MPVYSMPSTTHIVFSTRQHSCHNQWSILLGLRSTDRSTTATFVFHCRRHRPTLENKYKRKLEKDRCSSCKVLERWSYEFVWIRSGSQCSKIELDQEQTSDCIFARCLLRLLIQSFGLGIRHFRAGRIRCSRHPASFWFTSMQPEECPCRCWRRGWRRIGCKGKWSPIFDLFQGVVSFKKHLQYSLPADSL